MVLDRSAWMSGVFMSFLLSVPCTDDLLPHHQKIPERCKIISGDQPDLETHNDSYEIQQLEDKVGLLKILQTLHSYQVTI